MANSPVQRYFSYRHCLQHIGSVTALVFVLGLTGSPPLSAGSLAGGLEADTQVSALGASQYTLAIEVPPGIVGMAPDLAIQYSSQQGPGLLGQGMILSGISTISRCPANLSLDGRVGAVNFNADDRFCLDGARLVLVKGEYGRDGSEYRTEAETWTRIIAKGTCGTGPCAFKAHTKAGWELDFAASANSRPLVPGAREVISWQQERTTDLHGNAVSISYQLSSTDLQNLPRSISYTQNLKNGVMTGSREVRFNYEARADAIPRYIGGQRFVLKQRLASISTWVEGKPVLEYRLAYQQSATTQHSLLTSISLCSAQTQECLEPSKFNWQPATAQVESPNGDATGRLTSNWCTGADATVTDADFNGDGRPDLLCTQASKASVLVSTGTQARSPNADAQGQLKLPARWCEGAHSQLGWADFNGDRKTDVICLGGDSVFKVLKSTGKDVVSVNQRSDGSLSVPAQWCDAASKCSARVTNFTGQGKADLACDCENGDHRVLVSTGQDVKSPNNSPMGTVATGFCKAPGATTSWADFNGDGQSDLLCHDHGKHSVLVSNGSVLRSPNNDAQGALISGWCAAQDDEVYGADFNGDGLSDLACRSVSGRVQVLLSTGNGVASPNTDATGTVRTGWCAGLGSRLSWADFNGDGQADAICHTSDGKQLAMVSNGTQLVAGGAGADGLLRAGWCEGAQARAYSADFNGDGLHDLRCSNKGTESVLTHAKGFPDLLSRASNGLGGSVAFTYLPMTDDNVYSPGGEATYPTVDVRTPLYLVERYSSADGQGNTYNFLYHYRGARTQLDLRRWLGFQQVKRTRLADGRYSLTDYSQDYPITGFINKVSEFDKQGVELQRSTFVSRVLNTYKHVNAVLRDSESMSTFTAGKADYLSRRRYAYDSFGNIVLTADEGDVSAPEDDLFDCWVFSNATENWRLSYPTAHLSAKTEESCTRFLQDPERAWAQDTDLRRDTTTYNAAMDVSALSTWDDQNQLWLTQKREFDGFGNAISMTDWAGAVTRLSIDPSHTFVVEVTSPVLANGIQLKTQSTFDPGFGVETSTVDANGNERRNELDGLGRVVREFGPGIDSSNGAANVLLSTTRYLRDNTLTLVEVAERNAWDQDDQTQWPRSKLYVDGLSRPVRTVRAAPLGGQEVVTETRYDSAGRVQAVGYPRFASEPQALLTYAYDALDRITRLTQPDGTYQRIDYLKGSLKVRTTQAAGTSDERIQTKFTSVRNAITRTEAANGAAVNYQYDPLLQTLQVQGPQGDVTNFRYDSLGRVLESTSTDTGKKSFRYTPQGRLDRAELADGAMLRYTYDVMGRVLQQQTHQAGQPEQNITYTYDAPTSTNARGQLTQIDVQGTTQTRAYNRQGQVSSESLAIDDQHFTETYQYAPDGQRTLLTYPDGATLSTSYDNVGNPATLQFREHAGAPATTIAEYLAFTAQNKVRALNSGNGLATRFEYFTYQQSMARLKHMEVQASDADRRLGISYAWNYVGQLLSRREVKGTRPEQTTAYAYDAMGWLTRANGPQGDLHFAYDNAGNITQKDGVNYTYKSASNQIEGANNGLQASHDSAGNVTALKWPGADWGYTYSPLGQLASVTLDGQLRSQFRYDANGNRLERKDASGDTSVYVSADFDITTQNGVTLYTRYINSDQGRIAASTVSAAAGAQPVNSAPAQSPSASGLPQPGALFFHSDNIASTVLVSDAQGKEASALTYLPYGAIDQANSQGQDHYRPKFSSKELDQPTGLYYFGARYQNPVIGRFLQPDPKNQFTSPYSYAGNDPLTQVDPNGEEIITAVIIASTVIGATIGAYSGAAAVNNNLNPGYWDWSKGKTYAGIFAGAGIGAAGGAIGGAAAEAGVAAGVVGEIAVGAVEGASFSAMGGGSPLEVVESALTGGLLGGLTAGAGSAFSSLSSAGSRMAARGEASVFEQASEQAASLGAGRAGRPMGRAGREAVEDAKALRSVESAATEPRLQSPSQTEDLLSNLDSACYSFPAGVMIATAQGPKAIETIRTGQQVRGMNAYGETGDFTVLSTHQRDAKDIIAVRMEGGTSLGTTKEHPFWTQERGWVKAGDLKAQEHLLDDRHNPVAIEQVAANQGEGRVYNFEVATTHNYFAGDAEKQVLVHNAPSCRLLAMGRTPSKYSKVGQTVMKSFERRGWARTNMGNKEVFVQVVKGGPRVWKKLDRSIHMGHRIDAVSWWNSTGYLTGAKSPQVRNFMLDPRNYRFEWGPLNSSNGASLNQTYRRPTGWSGSWP